MQYIYFFFATVLSLKNSLAFGVHSVRKQIVLFHIIPGCQHNFISGLQVLNAIILHARLIMKAISKGSLAGYLVHMDAGSTGR